MYAAFTIEPLENRPLMLFGNTNAGIRNINLHIHFPTHNSHMDFPALWCVLHRIIQNVEQGFGCPFSVMGRNYRFRAIHCDRDFFLFSVQQNTAQRSGKGIINGLRLWLQRNHAGFQPGSFNHCLHEKIQLVKLAIHSNKKFSLLFRRHRLFQQRCVQHFQVCNRRFDLMGYIRNQFLQVGPFLCNAAFAFPQHFIEPGKSVLDFIKQVFFLGVLRRGLIC